MKERAFSIPNNSEEFLALGEYMSYASSIFFMEMLAMVKYLSAVACDLSRYSELPKKLWQVLGISIDWIQNISFAFLKFSTIYEAGQLDAEEKLVNMVIRLNHDLDTFPASLECLNYIDDIDKLVEYRFVIQKINFVQELLQYLIHYLFLFICSTLIHFKNK